MWPRHDDVPYGSRVVDVIFDRPACWLEHTQAVEQEEAGTGRLQARAATWTYRCALDLYVCWARCMRGVCREVASHAPLAEVRSVPHHNVTIICALSGGCVCPFNNKYTTVP